MTSTLKATSLSLVAGTALLLAVPGAQAADPSPSGQAQSPAGTPAQEQSALQTDFSDQELRSFANAAGKVQELAVQWQERLRQVEDEQKAQQMRETATEELRQAVRDEGLTIEKYNRISMAAREDAELRDKIVGHINENQ